MAPIRESDNSSESWLAYRREVVSFMSRIEERIGRSEDRINAMAGVEQMQEDMDRIEAKLDRINDSVITLKAKAGLWGAIAAVVTAPAIQLVIWLYGRKSH